MLLGLVDRIVLIGVVPREGNVTTLRASRDLIAKIGFSAEELEEFEIITQPGANITQWNPDKAKEVEIEFLPAEVRMLKEAMDTMNTENRLPLDILDVFDKFAALEVEEVVTESGAKPPIPIV